MNRDYCMNCMVYGWPTEDVTVFRCSNCKYLSYCSLECQREHWKKVHRKQCKTLAGQVEVPASTHLPNSCLGCKEEQELDTESINSQDSPAWGCLMSPRVTPLLIGGKFPSAIESGEMARNFPTKTEHTLFVMQQIVQKLWRTNPGTRMSRECQAKMTKLADLLAMMRIEFIEMHHALPAKMMGNHIQSFSSHWEELVEAVAVSVFYVNLGPSAGDPFLAMETLKLLAGFLLNGKMHINHKNFERLSKEAGLSSDVCELVGKLVPSTKFEEIWDSVLEALKVGLVHHHILLDILCGGNRKQECNQCQISVVIERVYVPAVPFSGGSKCEKPFITFRAMDFSCAAMDCQVATRKKAECLNNRVLLVMSLSVGTLDVTVCDNCFMCSRSMHRCSQCKTKVYCSEECQMEDWKIIHEKVCNEGDVVKKVRKFQRVDVVKKRNDKYVADYVAEIENDPEMDPAVKQMCLDFVEKIQ